VVPKRSVMRLVGFCVLAVLSTALAFAIIVASAAVAQASHRDLEEPERNHAIAQNELAPNPLTPATFNGMITDSYCGARHMRRSQQNSAECARACVRRGATYVLVDGNRRYQLTGENDGLERLAGQRATVTGTRQGGTIVVNSVAPLLLP
jgi:hypothetical protein